jgi:recombinational DNA repair protein (RecF pathway)
MGYVPTIKKCVMCGVPISNEYESSWYRHIRIMYCDECREQVQRIQNADRVRKYRAKKQRQAEFNEIKLKTLETENEILRQRLKGFLNDI